VPNQRTKGSPIRLEDFQQRCHPPKYTLGTVGLQQRNDVVHEARPFVGKVVGHQGLEDRGKLDTDGAIRSGDDEGEDVLLDDLLVCLGDGRRRILLGAISPCDRVLEVDDGCLAHRTGRG
jgi:hypothetical protein